MTRTQYQKAFIMTLKYLPLLTAFSMFIHVILLMIGFRLGFAETLFGLSVGVGIPAWLASKGLGFCKTHRMFIYYTTVVYLCIQFEQYIGFGILLTPMRACVIILGIIMFTNFIFNIKQFIKCNNECSRTKVL